ncbi:MAG: bifunctional phosphoribosylaminoimidazolecarboxamide formyltransferase/IMP cyclohydrolase, partial [Paracoccaceae bacterium]|nr:bifunctional phosphoribosylaminoimidazolecarboxamide formyltransferase/IMP cyclohydrolase [Paracoccaceae bacterium]
MTELLRIRRALISVSDKTGLIDLAKALIDFGIDLISTGGTATAIREAGLKVTDVSELTGFPEMMDGRVKTLHPNVHGGLLGIGDSKRHMSEMVKHDIKKIDLLIVNLYPFEETVEAGFDFNKCIEKIDIGGPAMLRSAAKNHKFVNVVTDVEDYKNLLEELEKNNGKTSYSFRCALALTAFSRTAAYDSAVSIWLAKFTDKTPKRLTISGELVEELRYGENPHQVASFYKTGLTNSGLAGVTKWQGKELSYNNINDTDAAQNLISEFNQDPRPVCVIIKHANPCGVAFGATLKEAYLSALACDKNSAFGGIVAFNKILDEDTAKELIKLFTEVVIAPDITKIAKKVFETKKNLRLLTASKSRNNGCLQNQIHSVSGGFLVQSIDNYQISSSELKVVTKKEPTSDETIDLMFAWKVAKHVKSNAIVFAKNGATKGIGAGQM